MNFCWKKLAGKPLLLLHSAIILVIVCFNSFSRTNFICGHRENIAEGHNNSRIVVAFRNDDISFYSDPKQEYEILRIFRKYSIKPLYAVIPILNNKPITNKMRIAELLREWNSNGWIDIAQHGYTHERNRHGSGEFRQLTYLEQLNFIKKGRELLHSALNIDVEIFCPPWNAADELTLKALSDSGFTCFSGYVGSNKPQDFQEIDCNCTLFDGPLGGLMKAYEEAKSTENNSLLVVLMHTSYEINDQSLLAMDNIISLLKNDPSVSFVSFSDLQRSEYRQIIENQNKYSLSLYEFWNDLKVKLIKKISKISGINLIHTAELSNKIRNSIWKNDYKSFQNILHDAKSDVNFYFLLLLIISLIIMITIIIICRKFYFLRFNNKRAIESK